MRTFQKTGIRLLMVTLFTSLMFSVTTSCSDNKDDSTSGKTFGVDSESTGFTRNSGKKSVNVTCGGVWNTSVSGSWATVNPSAGSGNGSLSISVSANPDQYKTRSCTVTVSSGGEYKYISVLQKVTSK